MGRWRVEEVRTVAWRLFKCWSLGKEGTVERQGFGKSEGVSSRAVPGGSSGSN